MTIPLNGVSLSAHRDWLRELVALGYTDLWTAEVAGADAFTPLAVAATIAPELRLGTAIASVFSRGPGLLAMEAAALADAAPGRFVLGIGASSEAIVQGWNDRVFEKPYRRMRDSLRFLRAALAGERVDRVYGAFSVAGFSLERPPAQVPPIFVAALQQRMLGLAGAEADGALLGLVAAEDVPRVRAVVDEAAPAQAYRDIVLRIGVLPTRDAERARASCRRLIAAYLSVPAYAGLHRWLGRADLLEPMWRAWAAGERKRAAEAVPDELVDALFVHGPPESCREQIQRFVDAGVTTPVLSIMPFGGDLREALRALSPEAAA
jgi:probable F420-dependent oxidoreductase